MRTPTYPAAEIKEMAASVLDYEAMRVLAELINEEISLYSREDMEIISEASLILFNRSLLFKFLK